MILDSCKVACFDKHGKRLCFVCRNGFERFVGLDGEELTFRIPKGVNVFDIAFVKDIFGKYYYSVISGYSVGHSNYLLVDPDLKYVFADGKFWRVYKVDD